MELILASEDQEFDELRVTPIARGHPHMFEGSRRLPGMLSMLCDMDDGRVLRIERRWQALIPESLLWPSGHAKVYYVCPRCVDTWV
jgi:hypothetical protein